ncbi:MAG: hypothetical protein KDD47_25215 [Acidobacteria bacterium]|nr:hypothetical protein [Acidobacteriota bacterium]
MEDLNSGMSSFYKVVFPAIWIGGFSLATILMFVNPDAWAGDGEVRVWRWVLLAVALVGGTLLGRFSMGIKTVYLGDHEFEISDGRRTIRVPFSEVARVTSSRAMNPQLLYLHFRNPTEFGSKIYFIPELRVFGRYKAHPLEGRLNDLLVVARSKAARREREEAQSSGRRGE